MAKKISIQPLHDRVVVEPIDVTKEQTSPSGIIIPETVEKEKPEQGIVMAVGPGKFDDGAREPMDVKVGDRVLFSKYGHDTVTVDGTEYYILSESNVLAVIK